jgi:hypothetical protein
MSSMWAPSEVTSVGWKLLLVLIVANMGVHAIWLPMVALIAGDVALVSGQNSSAAGPPWIQSEYMSSPPVYPSRPFSNFHSHP